MTTKVATKRRDSSALLTFYYQAPPEALFNQEEIAQVLRLSPFWLERARWGGGGPPFIRSGGTESTDKRGKRRIFGGRIRYRKGDVDEWLRSQKAVNSTSEFAANLRSAR